MISMDISQELNEEQHEAATHIEGPLLVLAGAGSGKTRCVTYRIVYLLECGIPSNSILGLTFTNKAAQEMRERVESLTNRSVLISTFHSLGARILRESIHHIGFNNRFIIYDEDDSIKLIKRCLKEAQIDEKSIDPKVAKQFISRAKNAMLTPDLAHELCESWSEEQLLPIYQSYQEYLNSFNAVDFDDLLFLTLKLFQDSPSVLERYQNQWQFLLVDEYQDTNAAQYEIINLLASKTKNLFVVGDPDQSIYSWRGANISNILNFEKDYPDAKVVTLERNYRSTNTILSASNELIRNNPNRYEKRLWSDLGEGEKIKHFLGKDEFDEARFVAEKVRYYNEELDIPLNEMVIFYRTNFQSRVFEDQLLSRSIPYKITGGLSFYQRKEIKDILAYLKLAVCPSDYISFSRSINLPKRGIGAVTADKIMAKADELNMAIMDFCQSIVDKDPSIGGFKLSKKQHQAICKYVDAIRLIKDLNEENTPVGEIILSLVDEISFFQHLESDKEQGNDRKDNIYELQGKANQWSKLVDEPTIEGFLEEMSLRGQDVEEVVNPRETLNLMTLHNGKGLEFRVVFIAGMDNDLLPHANSRDSFEALQEERRLLYVGMTRAKENLYLSSTQHRHIWGQNRKQTPSCFLREIPVEYMQHVSLKPGAYRSFYEQEDLVDDPFDESDPFLDDSSDSQCFKPGEAVFHKDFGVGLVQKCYEGSVGTMVDVLFSSEQKVKSLVLKYAKLERL